MKEYVKEYAKKQSINTKITNLKVRNILYLLTEDVNRVASSTNGNKRIQWIDSIETYTNETSKNLVFEKEKIKCSNIIKQYKND